VDRRYVEELVGAGAEFVGRVRLGTKLRCAVRRRARYLKLGLRALRQGHCQGRTSGRVVVLHPFPPLGRRWLLVPIYATWAVAPLVAAGFFWEAKVLALYLGLCAVLFMLWSSFLFCGSSGVLCRSFSHPRPLFVFAPPCACGFCWQLQVGRLRHVLTICRYPGPTFGYHVLSQLKQHKAGRLLRIPRGLTDDAWTEVTKVDVLATRASLATDGIVHAVYGLKGTSFPLGVLSIYVPATRAFSDAKRATLEKLEGHLVQYFLPFPPAGRGAFGVGLVMKELLGADAESVGREVLQQWENYGRYADEGSIRRWALLEPFRRQCWAEGFRHYGSLLWRLAVLGEVFGHVLGHGLLLVLGELVGLRGVARLTWWLAVGCGCSLSLVLCCSPYRLAPSASVGDALRRWRRWAQETVRLARRPESVPILLAVLVFLPRTILAHVLFWFLAFFASVMSLYLQLRSGSD
jgi:hypothetical protein